MLESVLGHLSIVCHVWFGGEKQRGWKEERSFCQEEKPESAAVSSAAGAAKDFYCQARNIRGQNISDEKRTPPQNLGLQHFWRLPTRRAPFTFSAAHCKNINKWEITAPKSTSSESASSPRMCSGRTERHLKIQSDANSGITGVNYRSLPRSWHCSRNPRYQSDPDCKLNSEGIVRRGPGWA